MTTTSGVSSTVAGATSDLAASKLTQNFDTFLTLLTTQLKNQDPLSPMESQEFVNQLVQFTEAEQAITTNKKLEELLALQNTSQTTAALGYIGNTIEAEGSAAPFQDGKAEFTYTLDKSGPTAIVVTDANGMAIKVAAGEAKPGKHSFVWDGALADGSTAPPGFYKIVLRDVEGKTMQVPTSGIGKVTGVESGADGTMLVLDDLRIPIDDVLAVRSKLAAAD